jgi:hypothetical protein
MIMKKGRIKYLDRGVEVQNQESEESGCEK